MYRQILVDPTQRNHQRIIWRNNPSEPLQDYSLKTVTYGVASAPVLALRTVQQLATDYSKRWPLAAKVMQSDMYMDDIVTGCPTLEMATQLQEELNNIFRSAGFVLHKWSSNHPTLISPNSDLRSFDIEANEKIKILGLKGSPNLDIFTFEVNPLNRILTKRSMLSEVSRIFDPLGFLSPVTFLAKHLLQQLRCLGTEWDQPPPQEIGRIWNTVMSQLPTLSKTTLPQFALLQGYDAVEIHAFCDASEKCYAAVLYFRCIQGSTIKINLICSKSKVAPLKSISIPRLKISVAHLLVRLVSSTLEIIRPVVEAKIYAWSDSTVALAWIRTSPHRWKTYVANRVSSLQSVLSHASWHHIRSENNPADCASRGILPSELSDHPLWWAGPPFLALSRNEWPMEVNCTENEDEVIPEEAKVVDSRLLNYFIEKYSSLRTIQRVLGYCLRFVKFLKPDSKTMRMMDPLSEEELHHALLLLVR